MEALQFFRLEYLQTIKTMGGLWPHAKSMAKIKNSAQPYPGNMGRMLRNFWKCWREVPIVDS